MVLILFSLLCMSSRNGSFASSTHSYSFICYLSVRFIEKAEEQHKENEIC